MRRTCARTCAGTNVVAKLAETFMPAQCPAKVNEPGTSYHVAAYFFMSSVCTVINGTVYIVIKDYWILKQ